MSSSIRSYTAREEEDDDDAGVRRVVRVEDDGGGASSTSSDKSTMLRAAGVECVKFKVPIRERLPVTLNITRIVANENDK